MIDEDSADEDSGGLVDNLSGNQLRAYVDIELPSNEQVRTSDDYIYYNAEPLQPGHDHHFIFPGVQKPKFKKKKRRFRV